MEEYLANLKNKKNYSDEFIEMLDKIIKGFIAVLGDEYTNLVLNTFSRIDFFQYENIADARNKLDQAINDGQHHTVNSICSAFMDDYYVLNGDQATQRIFVGVPKNFKLQTLIHELAHALSVFDKFKVEGNAIRVNIGFGNDLFYDGQHHYDDDLFSELVTENIAMQVMDYIEPTIEHSPASYQRIVNDFKGVFRNETLNKVIINDYLKSTWSFFHQLEGVISKDQINEGIDSMLKYLNLNDPETNQYLEYIRSLSVEDFFRLYVDSTNKYFKLYKDDTAKLKADIIMEVVSNISQKLMEVDYSK